MDENVPAHKDAHASSSRESASEPRGKVVSGEHSIHTHFPKDRNCDICMKTKITKAPRRKCTCTAIPRAEKFGVLPIADHKVLCECESRNNHRYAVVVQDLATQWIQSYPCKTKTSQETEKSLQKFLEPTSFSLTIPWNLAKLVKTYPGSIHCTSTPHRSETMGLLTERYAELRKGLLQYCFNKVWMKNDGRIPRSVKAICETYKISCLMGRHISNGDSANHFKDQQFHLVR